METQDALELVFKRNAFYRRLHFLVLGAFAISLVTIVLLIVTIFYIKRHPPHPYYFAADKVSRLLRIIPVTTPNKSTADVAKWTINAVEAAFTYDYVNFHEQLQSAQKYFTNYGWSRYMAALVASNNLNGVVRYHLVSTGTVIGEPKLIVQGILGGAYAWKFEMPLLVKLVPGDDSIPGNRGFSNAWTVTVIVQRQSDLGGNEGLGIVQLVVSETTASDQGQQ